MITRLKLSTVEQGLPKYRSMLAGNTAFVPAFESIATTTVGAGGAATVTFSSIPSTYTHLQLRFISRSSFSGKSARVNVQFNSDTGSNYAYHYLRGDGSSVTASASTSTTVAQVGVSAAATATASIFGTAVVDILDYTNTNKYKTIRSINGVDLNEASTSAFVSLWSSLWMSTSTITSISITSAGSANLEEYSHFALYGIKVAS